MDEQELSFPLRGIDRSRAFVRQTGETTPTARNVRAFDDLEDRRRGGSRDGIARWIDDTVIAGEKIQGLGCVVSMAEEFVSGYFPFEWPDFAVDPVTFSPIRPGGSGESSVPRKPPRLTWAPGAISLFEDETFGATHLNAAAKNPVDLSALAGTFSYSPPSGTVFGTATERTVTATFTPTDTTNFRSARATYTFKKKKTPTYVDWTVTTPVADGTVLDGTILNATGKNKDTGAAVPGTVTYDLWYFNSDGVRVNLDASGAVLRNSLSPYYLNAFFTPTNTTRFDTAKKEVVIEVNAPVVGGPPYTFQARDLWASLDILGLVPSEVDVYDSALALQTTYTFSEIKMDLWNALFNAGFSGSSGGTFPTWPGPLAVSVADDTQADGGGLGTWHYQAGGP